MAQQKNIKQKDLLKKQLSKPAAMPLDEVRFKIMLQDKMIDIFLKENIHTDLNLLLDKIFSFIKNEVGSSRFALYIINENAQLLTIGLNDRGKFTKLKDSFDTQALSNPSPAASPTLTIPILLAEKIYGSIEVEKDSIRQYFQIKCAVLEDIAGMAAMVVDFMMERQTEKLKIFRKNAQLEVMHDVGELINSITDMSRLLNIIINMVRDVMNVEICTLMMIDEETSKLVLTAQGGLSENIEENFILFTIWEEIASWIVKNENPLLIEDITRDKRFNGMARGDSDIKSFISVPLRIKGRINGILNANKRKDRDVFEKEDLDLFVTFANQVAKAIESAQLYEDLQEVYLSTITSLVSAIEAKDPYTHGHSERVARYSVEIARHYNPPFDRKELEILNYAAILHDIGKIGIKEQILNKIEPLLDEEFLLIRSHPNIGADIIKPIKFLQSAATIAQHHHERFDGKGYPDGLKGEEIPLGARIICVADSFDAMTSTRAYRGSLPEEIAVKEVVDDKGTQFDPTVVDVFLRIYPDLKQKGVIKL